MIDMVEFSEEIYDSLGSMPASQSLFSFQTQLVPTYQRTLLYKFTIPIVNSMKWRIFLGILQFSECYRHPQGAEQDTAIF